MRDAEGWSVACGGDDGDDGGGNDGDGDDDEADADDDDDDGDYTLIFTMAIEN